jgi:diguanylate cyclase (GGDEF)-like protein
MNRQEGVWTSLSGELGAWFPVLGGLTILAISASLRQLSISPDPLLFGQLQFTSGIVALTLAGAALVRFRGTRDRFPLILSAGFAIAGITLASSSLASSSLSASETSASLRDPMTWVIGRTLLAILLVSALFVDQKHAWSQNPGRDISVALILVVLLTALLSLAHRHLPLNLVVQPGRFFPHPGNLIPAGLFVLASLGYHGRLKNISGPFDRSLYLAAALNLWCSLAAAQSDRQLDTNFALAAALQFTSYAALLAGALLDNLRLFQNIHRLAISDSVTGLANYRRLLDVLEIEMERTGRTGKPFALLLFDLDGLKRVNDEYGHQVGTQALCRVADVLRAHSRVIDTGARHGGDEFALVLPETTEQGALEVARRVCDRVATDGRQPSITVSAGLATYPQDANTVDELIKTADCGLYCMKEEHKRIAPLMKHTAV